MSVTKVRIAYELTEGAIADEPVVVVKDFALIPRYSRHFNSKEDRQLWIDMFNATMRAADNINYAIVRANASIPEIV